MSPAVLSLVLAVALTGIAIVLNHCYARVALVELALNEGLPPGHQHTPITRAATVASQHKATEILEPGLHVFLSRNCHACQRLIDELSSYELVVDAPLHIRYQDRPRPIAASTAERLGASLVGHQAELLTRLGADPLPYTIAIGNHALVARAVTPTVTQLIATARDAGISTS